MTEERIVALEIKVELMERQLQLLMEALANMTPKEKS